MKKFFIYGVGAVMGLSLVACDDYEEPNPPAQSNPQESILQTSEVNVSPLATGTYNLDQLNQSETSLNLASIACSTLPQGYEFQTNVEISNDNFETSYVVPSDVEYNDESSVWVVSVTPDNLQGVYQQNFTKDPAQTTLSYRLQVCTVINKQVAYVGGPTHYYGPFSLTFEPYFDHEIEDAYYLVSSANGWDLQTAVELTNGGGNPYDDAQFKSVIFTVTEDQAAAGYQWKIVPASTVAAGTMDGNTNYGGGSGLEGKLVLDGSNGVLNEAGPYELTIDMQALTYKFVVASPYLYTPGSSNNWTQTDSQLLYTSDYTTYNGYAYLSGEFKFTNAPDWDHTNYGATDEAGTLTTAGDAGNLTVETPGLYWATVNVAKLTYSLAAISTYGVVGDATPGGWDASTALTPSEDFLTWEGDVLFSGTGEWKLRANDAWDINLGGNMQNLNPGGDNIATPGEGTYHVVLKLGQLPYAVEVTKK